MGEFKGRKFTVTLELKTEEEHTPREIEMFLASTLPCDVTHEVENESGDVVTQLVLTRAHPQVFAVGS